MPPRRRRFRKRIRSRRRRFRRFRGRGRRRRGRRPIGLPRIYKCTLLYNDQHLLTPAAAGIPDSDSYHANGLFDPFAAVGGHQPRYYDQLAPFYTRWTVTGAKIVCTFINEEPVRGVVCAVLINGVATAPTLGRQYIEDPGTRWRALASRDAGSPTTITQFFSLRKEVGVHAVDQAYSGSVGADPSTKFFFHIGVFSTNPAMGTAPTSVEVKIFYRVTFFNDILPSAS